MQYTDYGPEHIKHLEMIQAVVARLGTDSFLVKGWSITLSGALFGFAISGDRWQLAALAVVPSVALWALDAYFLRAERLFRRLYDAVRTGEPEVAPFEMSATGSDFVTKTTTHKPNSTLGWKDVLLSGTLCAFYLVLVTLAVVLAVFLAAT